MKHSHAEGRVVLIGEYEDRFGRQRIGLTSVIAVLDIDEACSGLIVHPLLDPTSMKSSAASQSFDSDGLVRSSEFSVETEAISEVDHSGGHSPFEFGEDLELEELQQIRIDVSHDHAQ
jgi:hypothetical protein